MNKIKELGGIKEFEHSVRQELIPLLENDYQEVSFVVFSFDRQRLTDSKIRQLRGIKGERRIFNYEYDLFKSHYTMDLRLRNWRDYLGRYDNATRVLQLYPDYDNFIVKVIERMVKDNLPNIKIEYKDKDTKTDQINRLLEGMVVRHVPTLPDLRARMDDAMMRGTVQITDGIWRWDAD